MRVTMKKRVRSNPNPCRYFGYCSVIHHARQSLPCIRRIGNASQKGNEIVDLFVAQIRLRWHDRRFSHGRSASFDNLLEMVIRKLIHVTAIRMINGFRIERLGRWGICLTVRAMTG